MKRTRNVVTTMALAGFITAFQPLRAQPGGTEPGGPKPLLSKASLQTSVLRKRDPNITRARIATLNFNLFEASARASTIALNLFPDRSYTVRLDAAPRSSLQRPGTQVLTGQIEGVAQGQFVAVLYKGRLCANVHAIKEEFQIRSSRDSGSYVVEEYDASAPIRCGVTATRAEARRLSRIFKRRNRGLFQTRTEDGSRIDVLVVYTARALSLVPGNTTEEKRAELERQVKLAEADTNVVLQRSQVSPLTVHVVSTEPVASSFVETNLYDDLTRISEGPVTAQRRSALFADQVTLITAPDNAYWGIAFLLTRSSQTPQGDNAYSVIDCNHISNYYVFTHELGHSLGCQHNRAASYDSNGNFMPGYFPYSHGQWFEGNDGVIYGTIMSYEGERIRNYSNPGVSYQGAPTGDPALRDNARTIMQTKSIVANYRTRP